MTLMNVYNLSSLFFACCRQFWCYCSNAPASRYCAPAQGSALLIILSTCCMCSTVLWISGCHVCVFTGFHPYGTVQSWTKLNRTGCQEQDQVRQQGEHVKRPDAFLFRDSDWVRQLVPAREVSKCEMRLFCIKASVVKVAESCRDRLVTGRSAVWNASWENLTKLSSFANFTVNVPRSKALCTTGVAQDHKGCGEQVTGKNV